MRGVVVGTGDNWLASRKGGVTSTAMVALLGLQPWRPGMALDVYRQIVEGYEPPQFAPNQAAWGVALEPFLHQRIQILTGRQYRWLGRTTMAHPQHSHHRASPDMIDGDGVYLGEAKTTTSDGRHDYGTPYSDEVPAAVDAQVQWAMHVCGLQGADVIVGWTDRRSEDLFIVPRDDAKIATMIQIADDFWHNHVEAKRPPSPDAYAGSIQWPERRSYGRPKYKQAFYSLADYYREHHIIATTSDPAARIRLQAHDLAVSIALAQSCSPKEE